MLGRVALLSKNATKSMVRYSSEGGLVGANLPFSIENRYRLTAMFAAFFGSAVAFPFLVVRHQLLKK